MNITKSLRNALLLILGSAIPALGQTAAVTVSPASPTTDDAVVLTLAGQWTDSCVPGTAVPAVLTRQGTKVNVTFNYTAFSGACATVITPWSTSLNLGKLAAGCYQVEVWLSRSLAPAQLLGSASFCVTPPQLVRAWVPSFLASGPVTLASRLTAFNNGGGGAKVGLVAAYDESGRHDLSGGDLPLSPGASVSVPNESVTAAPVRFVEVAATTHVALRAALERLDDGVSKGRVALPIFPAPFAATTVAVAGDVPLRAGFKRANLTLFNAGTSAATFDVTVTSESGLTLSTASYTLAAQSARQVNGVVAAGANAASAWIRVTADQPFLAYASAVYEDDEPGTIPYEVFGARPQL